MKNLSVTLLLVMVLASLLPVPLTAAKITEQAQSGAYEIGTIWAKIGIDRLVISDMVYRVGPVTQIVGQYGQHLTLQDISVGSAVRIEADYNDARNGYLLRRIKMVGQ